MQFTPEELKSFPLWALEEKDTFAIEQWLGDWVGVIEAVQRPEIVPIPDVDMSEHKPRVPTEKPSVVRWLAFTASELEVLLHMQFAGCDLITQGSVGALLSNGDVIVPGVRVANHTGNPFSTHTLIVPKGPTTLLTKGLGVVVGRDNVSADVVSSVEAFLSVHPFSKIQIMLPALEDIIGLAMQGFQFDDALNDIQQLSAVLDHLSATRGWSIKRDFMTVSGDTLYSTDNCPLRGAVKLR
jgi:hypothetical protein